MRSDILCTIVPRLGRQPTFKDLRFNIDEILLNCRRDILIIFIEENRRDVVNLQNSVFLETQNVIQALGNDHDAVVKREDAEDLIIKLRNEIRSQQNDRFSKKIKFHSNSSATFNALDLHPIILRTRRQLRTETAVTRKREKNRRYKKRLQLRKQTRLKSQVDEIKSSNLVVNLSSVDVPDLAYLFLANGLGFVESVPCVKENLTYDVNNFLRKLSWKGFWNSQPPTDPNVDNTSPTESLHNDLRIPSKAHPLYQNALLDEIKSRVKSWVASFNPDDPKSNISPQAIRGKAWIMKALKEEKIFISKADKGGAILILDYNKVIQKMEEELSNTEKFKLLENTEADQLLEVKKSVTDMALQLEDNGLLSAKDRELITGLNANKNPKHAHVLKCQSPYAYPLLKLHKLSADQITEKMLPPMRLVHAQKFGPLYRVEKWLAPYLTDLSRRYCEEEFLLDTNDLLETVKLYNISTAAIPLDERPDLNLFTLDVEALYPSIDLDFALESLAEALVQDSQITDNTKEAMLCFSKLVLDQSYISFRGRCYASKRGIATGGCVSRQEADILLHRLFKLVKTKIPLWAFILLWRRFIDDIFVVWSGTKDQFLMFVNELNLVAAPYGIKFGDWSIGKSVNFLDVTLSINQTSKLIDYTLFVKPTDS